MTDQPQYPSYPGPEQPTPPPGHQPPPTGYGQSPPGYVPLQWGAPTPGTYAGWWSRVGAFVLDCVLSFATIIPFLIIGGVILGATGTTTLNGDGSTTIDGESPAGYIIAGLGYLSILVFGVWNSVFRQGSTGQSLGKSIVHIKVVRESTGQPSGAGEAFARGLLLAIFTVLTVSVNLLWPLWDGKHQALHDKAIGTIVVSTA